MHDLVLLEQIVLLSTIHIVVCFGAFHYYYYYYALLPHSIPFPPMPPNFKLKEKENLLK